MKKMLLQNNQPNTLAVCALLLVSFVFSCQSISAQDEKIPKGVVPPPLSLLSKDEKRSLGSATKLSVRTKIAVALMESRLLKAIEHSKKEEFQKSLNQLGNFRAILRDHMKHLNRFKKNKRALKYFKRFEMSLRKQIPRLELMRRKTPFKYAYHIRHLIKVVRKARSEAINTFFGDTVVPQR